MFRNVESLQRALYGDKHEVLAYTLKQIGVCNLGMGQAKSAKEVMNQAKELLSEIKSDEDDKETRDKDAEELSALENQLYVAHLLLKEMPEAIECSKKCIEILKSVHGADSQKLASKYYQLATTLQLNLQFDESIETIHKAIKVHGLPKDGQELVEE